MSLDILSQDKGGTGVTTQAELNDLVNTTFSVWQPLTTAQIDASTSANTDTTVSSPYTDLTIDTNSVLVKLPATDQAGNSIDLDTPTHKVIAACIRRIETSGSKTNLTEVIARERVVKVDATHIQLYPQHVSFPTNVEASTVLEYLG